MSNIEELQRRITRAMDRVAAGLDKIGSAPDPAPDPELVQALEDERTANAQLTERVRALRARTQKELDQMRARLDENADQMARIDTELQRLRRANEQLTDACAALREANAEGVGDAHLINKAMLAELDGLRAARAADVAETGAIIAALAPLLEPADTDASDTAQTEETP